MWQLVLLGWLLWSGRLMSKGWKELLDLGKIEKPCCHQLANILIASFSGWPKRNTVAAIEHDRPTRRQRKRPKARYWPKADTRHGQESEHSWGPQRRGFGLTFPFCHRCGCIATADITSAFVGQKGELQRKGGVAAATIGFVISLFDLNRGSFFISQVRWQVVNMRVNNPVAPQASELKWVWMPKWPSVCLQTGQFVFDKVLIAALRTLLNLKSRRDAAARVASIICRHCLLMSQLHSPRCVTVSLRSQLGSSETVTTAIDWPI